MNRGLAKRVVFPSRREIRYFQSRLAREVREGEIELRAFCFLTTHFHLLLASPRGHLSDAMRRVENSFVRWFNRRHARDGSLFRGRFTSRLIESDAYFWNVLRYIDQNPVDAGLVDRPQDYAYGSARYEANGAPPPWISLRNDGADAPARVRGGGHGPHARWVVERRLEQITSPDDPLDELLGAATHSVLAWMQRKARLADGSSPRTCIASPRAIRSAVRRARARHPGWAASPAARRKDGWRIVEIGLMRDAAGLSTTEASLELGIARSSVGHGILEHRQLLLIDPIYAKKAAKALRSALDLTFPRQGLIAIRDDRARLKSLGD